MDVLDMRSGTVVLPMMITKQVDSASLQISALNSTKSMRSFGSSTAIHFDKILRRFDRRYSLARSGGLLSLKHNMPPFNNTSFGNFDLLKKHPLGIRDITLYKWKSRVTGLSVLHIDYQGES